MSGEQLLYNRPLPGARLNMAHPLAKGLVGCWLLNEQMGLRAMDLSPYGNHGLLGGFPAGSQRAFNGLSFDGVDDYVDVPASTSLDLTTAFSLESWFKTSNITALQHVVSKRTATTSNYHLIVGSGSSYVSAGFYNGAWRTVDSAASIIVSNQWYHIVATWDGTNLRIFFDNVLVVTSADLSATPPLTNAVNVNIGRQAEGTEYFVGLIGEVRIYNWTLRAEDVKALYLSPYKPMGLPLFL